MLASLYIPSRFFMCSRKSIELKVADPTLGGSVVKNVPVKAAAIGDSGSNPGSGRSPGLGNGSSLQDSCLENPMDEEPGGLQSMGSQRVGHD